MSKEAEIESPPRSGNISVDQLGAMLNKSRKAKAAASSTPPVQATKPDDAPPQNEHADEAQPNETELEQAAAAPETEQVEAPETEAEEAEAKPEEEKQPKSKAVRDLLERVDKVTAQKHAERNARLEAERQLAEAQAKLTEMQQAPKSAPAAQANEQFAGDPSVAELDRTLADVEAFLEFAGRHPDGGSFEDGGKTYELDAEQMRAFRSKSEKERIRLSSKREARLEGLRLSFEAKRTEAHAEAVKLYPWIEQKASPEFQEAIKLIRENPGVMVHADFELIVARQIAGSRLETEARKKLTNGNGAARPPGSRTPAPVVTHAAAAAPKSGGAAKLGAQEAQFRASGRVGDLGKMLAERKRLREAA